jgi:hypothetical protein
MDESITARGDGPDRNDDNPTAKAAMVAREREAFGGK